MGLTPLPQKVTSRDCNWHNSGTREWPMYVNCALSAVKCFNWVAVKWHRADTDERATEWLQKIRHKLLNDIPLDHMDVDRLNAYHNAWVLKIMDRRNGPPDDL